MALRMRHRVALLLAASVGLSLVYTGSALAATQWVNDDPPVDLANSSCAQPGFNDIQSAVTAAGIGDTVRVCPGVYAGNVTVPKKLILRGAKFGVDARTRATANESIVAGGGPGISGVGFLLTADNIQLNGFTIRAVTNGPGVQTSPDFSGYTIANNIIQNNVFGIYANSSATFQNNIRTNLIKNNNATGAANGNGIYTDQGLNRLFVTRNVFRNQAGPAINFAGVLNVPALPADTFNRNLTVQFNKAYNNGAFVALFSHNANVQIRQNQTFDTVPGDNGGQGSGVRIADDAVGILVANNTFNKTPGSGVAVREDISGVTPDNVDINFNKMLGVGDNGVDITSSGVGSISVFRNFIRNAGIDGIHFDGSTAGNLINTNNAKFSGLFDCQDESGPLGGGTAGTDNTWSNNVGPVADPPGICHN